MNIGRGGALTALVLLVAIGCGGSDAPPNQAGGGTIGADGGVTEAPPPPPVGGTPIEAVFVSASKGIDGADGSMKRPVKTIAAALALAGERRPLPIAVCAETYTETVKLVDGITMFGYFDCTNLDEWKRVDDVRAVILSPTSPAVVAEKLAQPTRFEGFEVRAPDRTESATPNGPAESSIAMMISETSGLSLDQLILRAGRGADGLDGTEPAPNEQLGSPNGKNGGIQGVLQSCGTPQNNICNALEFRPGGDGGTSQCKVGPAGGVGGAGGDGRYFNAGGPKGAGAVYTGAPLTANASTEAGGAAIGSPGPNGQAGTKGPNGNAGANGVWKFEGAAFIPGDGTAGSDGGPGKGGGGGGGAQWYYCNAGYAVCSPSSPSGWFYGSQGGGGGAGGCAGLAGTAGKGGGASIGLLVIASPKLTIDGSRIEAGMGGKAGKGTLGTTGLAGGVAGNGGSTGQVYERGGNGGAGGPGGDAGPSGHGDPGPSIALAYSGPRPDVRPTVVLLPGERGAGHPSIARGDKVVPAVVGKALPEHGF